MQRRGRLESACRHGALALLLALAIAAPSPGAAALAGRGPASGPVGDGPIVISGKVKPLNRGVELAVDPDSGNGLAVWNRNKKRQNYGEIWAAELIRQDDGSYEAGKPFKVSQSKPAQRPTVEYLPNLDLYMVMWDEGARDPGATKKGSRILSRLYAPTGSASRTLRAGELGPEVAMTNGGTDLSPGLAYLGTSSVYERLVYLWRDESAALGRGADAREMPRGRVGASPTDVAGRALTLRGVPAYYDDDEYLDWTVLDVRRCGKRVCFLVASVDTYDPPYEVWFDLFCYEVAPGSTRATLVSVTEVGDYTETRSLHNVFGSIRRDGPCDPVTVVNNDGAFSADTDEGLATRIPFLDPITYHIYFHGVPTTMGSNGPARESGGAGLVTYRGARGKIEHRSLDEDGTPMDDVTFLWKTKRRRLLNMSVATTRDTVLVAWTENKNRRGSKAIVKLGWYVPE